jgi:hypothetical protein
MKKVLHAIPRLESGLHCVLILMWVCLFSSGALARVGGGQSYGGGGGNGGDGDGGALIWLVFQVVRLLVYLTIEFPVIGIPLDLIVIIAVIYFFVRRSRNKTQEFTSVRVNSLVADDDTTMDVHAGERGLEQLKRFDPNFSEIVFKDFCYALYAKAHEARGRGQAALDLLSPYLSEVARRSLLDRNEPTLKSVEGIIVGAMSVGHVKGLETPLIKVEVLFEANYSETFAGENINAVSYYVRERWTLERSRDLLSPTPAEATALHCPRCGAALQRDTVGACAFCGTKIDSGDFQWYVRDVSLLGREVKGPALLADIAERGTESPSVVQPGFQELSAQFEMDHPEFSWAQFQTRAKLIFDELQAAWSSLDWERARPHETDNIFQMHQYWIEAYKRQKLQNVLQECQVTAIQPVKIMQDAFYNSITLRIWAQGYDYTVNETGQIVSGSRQGLRYWSEYWTFIRNRRAKPAAIRTDLNCPNCAAPLKVNAAGICEFCDGKITSGEFDWVLSRIEQDESYVG